MDPIILNKEEIIVCRILYFAVTKRHSICDLTDFSQLDKEILESFEKRGYIKNDIECIVIKKEFNKFLEDTFGGLKNEF